MKLIPGQVWLHEMGNKWEILPTRQLREQGTDYITQDSVEYYINDRFIKLGIWKLINPSPDVNEYI